MYILYLTTNLITKQIYIGVHRQDEIDSYTFDGYLGSGDWRGLSFRKFTENKLSLKDAIKLYGSENFERTTIMHSADIVEIYSKEAELVTEEYIKFEWNYNLVPGGKIPPNHLKFKWYNNSIKECRIFDGNFIPDGYVKGRLPVKESTRIKIRNISLKANRRPPLRSKNNGYWTESQIKNTSDFCRKLGQQRKGIKLTEEHVKKIAINSKGSNNPMYGSTFKWINDGITQIRWTESIEKIPNGFSLGIIKKSSYSKHKIIQCPHCLKNGGIGTMKRWHFDNCKINRVESP